jgi:hypothetical protein
MNYFILAKIGNVNMKKTFQKTLIAVAAGAALMSAVGTASANSLLFPYFTTKTGAQTVLSLYSRDANATNGVHYVYNYGSACTHFDAYGKLTANDILSHSVAATNVGGFGKVVGSDTSTPVYFPLADQTGFVVVTARDGTNTDSIQGSAAIVDPSSGLVVSYPGISNGFNTAGAGLAGPNEGNFNAITDVNFPLTYMPTSAVSTSWYGVVVGDMNPAILAGADWKGVYTISNNGNVYNNDEVAFSGTVTKAITCAGSILATDLGTAAQNAAIGANGGLIKATGAATAATQATGAVLMKMQTVQAAVGAPFAGKQFLHREQNGI